MSLCSPPVRARVRVAKNQMRTGAPEQRAERAEETMSAGEREQHAERVFQRFWRPGSGSTSSSGYVPGAPVNPGTDSRHGQERETWTCSGRYRQMKRWSGRAGAREQRDEPLDDRPRGTRAPPRARARRGAGSRAAAGRAPSPASAAGPRSRRPMWTGGRGGGRRSRERARIGVRVAVGHEQQVGEHLRVVAAAVGDRVAEPARHPPGREAANQPRNAPGQHAAGDALPPAFPDDARLPLLWMKPGRQPADRRESSAGTASTSRKSVRQRDCGSGPLGKLARRSDSRPARR